MVKTGLIYRHGPFEATALLRYMGERYGDVAHKEKIDDFITAGDDSRAGQSAWPGKRTILFNRVEKLAILLKGRYDKLLKNSEANPQIDVERGILL